jgi:hypothetical protein
MPGSSLINNVVFADALSYGKLEMAAIIIFTTWWQSIYGS